MLTTDLQSELSQFNKSIDIVENKAEGDNATFLNTQKESYKYNQLETLNKIDRYYLSQYDQGPYDSEGQRKLFLNIVKFASDVAEKQTNMDVKDFTFVPDSSQYVDSTWFTKKLFERWTRENGYGRLINELNKDFSKYGSCIVKQVGKDLERVPIKTIKNKQDAESLQESVEQGCGVIQEHQMTPRQMRQMPNWLVPSDLENKEHTVYERHGYVRRSELEQLEAGEEDDEVLAVAFVLAERYDVLFIQEEDELPYEEAHWEKQDGRWLGIGEVENQFENQVARNITENLRHRNMLWGSKKIFQSADTDMVGKNLVQEVSDGEILEVGLGGSIGQIDMQTQHQVDFNASDQSWDENSRQKSFMFEINTGESTPSGTPFRMGVLLNNASQTHFNLKRQEFGFFLERAFFNKMLPIFRRQLRDEDRVLSVATNEEGTERLQRAMLNQKANERLKQRILDENLTRNLETLEFDFDKEKEIARQELKDEPYFFVTDAHKLLENARFKMVLSITGQEMDIPKQIESLSTLLQSLGQGDPARRQVLRKIMQLTGVDTSTILQSDQQQLQELAQAQNEGSTNAQATRGLSDLIQTGGGQGATGVPEGAGEAAS